MVLTTYGRSSGFCIDPIEKKPLNHFYPGSSVLSFGTAGCNLGCKFCQNWDISKSPRAWTGSWTRPRPRPSPPRRAAPGLQERGLHLQRPGHLRRVRDGRGRRLPRPRHSDRRGDGGLHARRAPARLLREDGRGQRRPEGLHGGASTTASPSPSCSRCSTRSSTSSMRRDVLVRDHDAAHPRAQRLGRGADAAVRVDRRASSAPTCPSTSRRFHPGLQDDGRAAHAAATLRRARQIAPASRAAPRLHRQRARHRRGTTSCGACGARSSSATGTSCSSTG